LTLGLSLPQDVVFTALTPRPFYTSGGGQKRGLLTAQPATERAIPSGHVGPSESGVTRMVAWTFLAGVGLVLTVQASLLEGVVDYQWPDLFFWFGLLIVVNLLPVEVGRLTLTLDVPITLAIAFLYEPAVAAILAGVAAFDRRELGRQISLSRAAFNRAQIATSVYLASTLFHAIAPNLQRWHTVMAATIVALLVDYVANSAMVMMFERINSGMTFSATLRRLKVGQTTEFLLTYLGYGLLALAIAIIFMHEGIWAIAVFLIPILVARQLLMRNQELITATDRLRAREILLERLLHGVVDERRDERVRVAADLHDDVLQGVTRIQQVASTLKTRRSLDAIRRDIEYMSEAAEYSLAALRQVMRNLSESPLGAKGLLEAIRGLAREVQLESGLRVVTELHGRVDASPEAQLVIFQVIREALWNASKHAKAGAVRIAVQNSGEGVELRVEDNGMGFDPTTVDLTTHFGLQLMRERLELIGGVLRVESEPGVGTVLLARVPRQQPLRVTRAT
jgi:signal transduction histidine kinase